MVYEVPASKASLKQNTFEFKVPGERKVRALPLLKYLPMGMNSRMAEAAGPVQAAQRAGRKPTPDELRELGSIQMELFNKYSPGLVDAVDAEQLGAIMIAWQEASGITVGESPASAGS